MSQEQQTSAQDMINTLTDLILGECNANGCKKELHDIRDYIRNTERAKKKIERRREALKWESGHAKGYRHTFEYALGFALDALDGKEVNE